MNNPSNYTSLPNKQTLNNVISNLETKGYNVFTFDSEKEALQKIVELIPSGSSIMNGSSTTLEQIGFTDLLKEGKHEWKNLHGDIYKETDMEKQSILRLKATMSEFYLGSVHALTQNGDLLIASNTGSQIPNVVYNSKNLIFVIGTQKITNDLNSALKRIDEYVVPLEDERAKKAYGINTALNKLLIFKGENKMFGRNINIILVNKVLGF